MTFLVLSFHVLHSFFFFSTCSIALTKGSLYRYLYLHVYTLFILFISFTLLCLTLPNLDTLFFLSTWPDFVFYHHVHHFHPSIVFPLSHLLFTWQGGSQACARYRPGIFLLTRFFPKKEKVLARRTGPSFLSNGTAQLNTRALPFFFFFSDAFNIPFRALDMFPDLLNPLLHGATDVMKVSFLVFVYCIRRVCSWFAVPDSALRVHMFLLTISMTIKNCLLSRPALMIPKVQKQLYCSQ